MIDWKRETIESALQRRGWYKSQREINYGTQFRLIDDTPIDFYDTGKVVVRGKATLLKEKARSLFERHTELP